MPSFGRTSSIWKAAAKQTKQGSPLPKAPPQLTAASGGRVSGPSSQEELQVTLFSVAIRTLDEPTETPGCRNTRRESITPPRTSQNNTGEWKAARPKGVPHVPQTEVDSWRLAGEGTSMKVAWPGRVFNGRLRADSTSRQRNLAGLHFGAN